MHSSNSKVFLKSLSSMASGIAAVCFFPNFNFVLHFIFFSVNQILIFFLGAIH